MSKTAADHHKASEYHSHAARHHQEAAKHHDAGNHEKAASRACGPWSCFARTGTCRASAAFGTDDYVFSLAIGASENVRRSI